MAGKQGQPHLALVGVSRRRDAPDVGVGRFVSDRVAGAFEKIRPAVKIVGVDPVRHARAGIVGPEGVGLEVGRRRAEPRDGMEGVAPFENALGRGFLADHHAFRAEVPKHRPDGDGRDVQAFVERGALDDLDAAKLDFALQIHVRVLVPLVVVAEGGRFDDLQRRRKLRRVGGGSERGHEGGCAHALQFRRKAESVHLGHVAEGADADVRDGGKVEDPVRGLQQVLVVVERHVRDARDGPRDVVPRRVDGLGQVDRAGVGAVAVGSRGRVVLLVVGRVAPEHERMVGGVLDRDAERVVRRVDVGDRGLGAVVGEVLAAVGGEEPVRGVRGNREGEEEGEETFHWSDE